METPKGERKGVRIGGGGGGFFPLKLQKSLSLARIFKRRKGGERERENGISLERAATSPSSLLFFSFFLIATFYNRCDNDNSPINEKLFLDRILDVSRFASRSVALEFGVC